MQISFKFYLSVRDITLKSPLNFLKNLTSHHRPVLLCALVNAPVKSNRSAKDKKSYWSRRVFCLQRLK